MKTIVLTALMLGAISVSAQKYLTREAYIKFYGSTPLENIEAVTNQGSSVIDASNGDIVFQVLVNSFTFEKALMQEHFNENYVESETYPKCVFRGKIQEEVDYSKPGKYEVTIKGTMTLHGVEQALSIKAMLIVEKGGVKLSAEFNMVPEDYNIEIPGAVRDKIAKQMDVTVKAAYKPV
jgi:polyisoprenoid-binding protein YceI